MRKPRRLFRTSHRLPMLGLAGWVLAMATAFVVAALAADRAYSAEIVAAATTTLKIEANRGRLVRLDRAAATVFIANPAIADIQVKSPSLVYLLGKKPGQTTLFAVDAGEKVLANIEIDVTHNLERLRKAVRELLPDDDIRLTSVDGSIVIDGVVNSASDAENVRSLAERFAGTPEAVINRLGVTAPSQVNLRVRVAEMSRDIDKQLGFNWSAVGSLGGLSIGLATANPFINNVATQTLTLGGKIGKWDLNTVIDAMEGEGLVKVLAEPNLTALSGETASFLAGGEFPILVPDSNGRVTIVFKKFGVSLAFTPTLTGHDRINMHIRPEVSQLSSSNSVTLNGFEVPSLVTRRADTTVELGSGQSFAIAGLLQNNVTHDINKFPGLGDVPVLGGLFRSDRFQREESELVILVTPYIVRPTTKAKLAAPTDGFAPPSDAGRFLIGGTHRRNPKAGKERTVAPDGSTLIGPVGFQLD